MPSERKMMVTKFHEVKYFIYTMSFKLTMKMIAVKEVMEKDQRSEPWPVFNMMVF